MFFPTFDDQVLKVACGGPLEHLGTGTYYDFSISRDVLRLPLVVMFDEKGGKKEKGQKEQKGKRNLKKWRRKKKKMRERMKNKIDQFVIQYLKEKSLPRSYLHQLSAYLITHNWCQWKEREIEKRKDEEKKRERGEEKREKREKKNEKEKEKER